MNLSESLGKFCRENLKGDNDWYNWKIDESKTPIEIMFPNGNHYTKNIILKKELHKVWQLETDTKKKGNIIKYYIAIWGGIRSNSNSSLEKYMYSTPNMLIASEDKGIASWSKALVIHNPDKYAIFDARVSISLNCLQLLFDTDNKILYPTLSSRNKTIIEGGKMIRLISKKKNWRKSDKSTFYSDYLKLLKKVSQENNTNISTIEMLLFAKAEYLVNEIKNYA